MRAIKIDSQNHRVSEIEISGDLKSMYAALECDTVTGIRITRKDYLWVDDNGLIIDKPIGAFELFPYPNPLSGHGLIIGITEGGDNTSTSLTVEDVRRAVKWVDVSELPEPVIQVHSWPSDDGK